MRYPAFLFLCALTLSCNGNQDQPKPQKTTPADTAQKPAPKAAEPVTEPRISLNEEDSVEMLNFEILQHLKSKKYANLARLIHPQKGVRFSMYGYVSDKDKKFSVTDFKNNIDAPIKFTWGDKDGTGDPLKVTFAEYLRTWVFKKDFSKSKLTINEFQGVGNSKNNLLEVYPNAVFTENYIPGTKANAEMDWYALRMVFEEYRGMYFLVAIINDQWTI